MSRVFKLPQGLEIKSFRNSFCASRFSYWVYFDNLFRRSAYFLFSCAHVEMCCSLLPVGFVRAFYCRSVGALTIDFLDPLSISWSSAHRQVALNCSPFRGSKFYDPSLANLCAEASMHVSELAQPRWSSNDLFLPFVSNPNCDVSSTHHISWSLRILDTTLI